MHPISRYRPRALLAVAIAAATLASAAAAPPPAAPARDTDPDNDVLIRDVRVFDGERVLPATRVLVIDGRIRAVGASLAAPDGVAVVDGRGKTLLPGLIDAHTHSWGDAARDALRFGVTAELDMLGDWNRLPALKAQRETLARGDQADLWSAGAAVTVPGGHGTQYGMKVPTLAADGDAAAFVAARVAEGSDYIKLILEDFSSHSPTQRWPTLTAAQAATAIAAAHRADRLAVVHVSRLADARAVVDAGADGLVHIFAEPADEAFVAVAKQRKAFVVPTLSVMAAVARSGEGAALAQDARVRPQLAGAQIDSLNATFAAGAPTPEVLDGALANVRALHRAGVDILAGTDAGNPGTAHGASLHGELALLVRAGLTPVQALAAATSVPARRFSLGDRGRIAPGQRADLLLVQGDPTRDITATRAIAGVWKNGYAIARPAPQATAAPVGEAPAAGASISDFDAEATPDGNGLLPARVGAGWMPTTDQMAGGASVVRIARVAAGAGGSAGALAVDGEIRPGFAFPWSGAMYFPAAQAMQPVDLSARRTLVFKVRGDGRTYQAMLFSGQQVQSMPSMKPFVAPQDWTEVRIALGDFTGGDLTRVRGIAFTAGQPAGAFGFRIDDVAIE